MHRRILIATNDAGGGHVRLSQALASGFETVADGQAEVCIEDLFALDQRSVPYRLARLYGPAIRHLPPAYGLLYHGTNHRWINTLLRRSQHSLLPRVRSVLRDVKPSAVVTTHPLVNTLILDALEAEGLRPPAVAQVSELASVHASWVEPRLKGYAVATEAARAGVIAHGAEGKQIRVVGLPIGPGFAGPPLDPLESRQRLGLDPHRFTVLALGGAEGAGKLRMVVRALCEVGDALKLQLVVVCGRNEPLRRSLERIRPPIPMRVLGYVNNVADLMTAADVVITKGGPQTIVEALALGRPLLVTQTLPGQEQGNDTFVERAGVGFSAPSAGRVIAAITRLCLDEDLYATTRQRARDLARPRAAAEVAEWVLNLADDAA